LDSKETNHTFFRHEHLARAAPDIAACHLARIEVVTECVTTSLIVYAWARCIAKGTGTGTAATATTIEGISTLGDGCIAVSSVCDNDAIAGSIGPLDDCLCLLEETLR
jgi:hypothetical protein